jgi:hypothetical protein
MIAASFLTYSQIDSDVIRNSLIIQQSIEQTALVWDREDARKVNKQAIRTVKQVWSSIGNDESQRGWGARHVVKMVNGQVNENIDKIAPWAKASRMRADYQEQLRYAC